MVFFNKNNDVVQRMIEQVTPKENIKISYKGDKTILAKPDDIPEGRYNPKYFQRQIAVSNMEKWEMIMFRTAHSIIKQPQCLIIRADLRT